MSDDEQQAPERIWLLKHVVKSLGADDFVVPPELREHAFEYVRADLATVAQPPEQRNGKDASHWVTSRLRPEHNCKPLARAVMMEGRDWWIGELLEPVADWPNETHCLHMKTPLKDVSFLCNAGDFEQLLVLSNVIVKLENLPWLRALTASAKARLMPPFSTLLPEEAKARRVCVKCGHEESYRNATRNYECYEGGLPPCGCRCEFTAASLQPPSQQSEEIAREIVGEFESLRTSHSLIDVEVSYSHLIERIASALTSAQQRGAEQAWQSAINAASSLFHNSEVNHSPWNVAVIKIVSAIRTAKANLSGGPTR